MVFKEIKNLKSIKEATILLSPASASYDQYKNFEKRGEEFKKLVKLYAKKFFKNELKSYWRNLDKRILFSFIVLFFWVFFLFLPHHL